MKNNPNSDSKRPRFHHDKNGAPYRHLPTREITPQSKEDLGPLKKLLVGGLLAATALAGANLIKDTDKANSETPSLTTTAKAEPGDTYWGMQTAEGDSGRDIRNVVSEAMELPANDRDGDGKADEIHPGMIVSLIDDPSTPPQP